MIIKIEVLVDAEPSVSVKRVVEHLVKEMAEAGLYSYASDEDEGTYIGHIDILGYTHTEMTK